MHPPTHATITAARIALAPHVRTTPVLVRDDLPGLEGTACHFKFELLQRSGTFKARGAFNNLLALSDAQRARGVTAISAGNHAIAVACAAAALATGLAMRRARRTDGGGGWAQKLKAVQRTYTFAHGYGPARIALRRRCTRAGRPMRDTATFTSCSGLRRRLAAPAL